MKKLLLVLSLLGLLMIPVTAQLQLPAVVSVTQSDLYGVELAPNNEFTSNITGWTGTNWAWQTGGYARHTTGNVGSMYTSSATTATDLVPYHVVIIIANMTAGDIEVAVGTWPYSSSFTTNGTHEFNITPTGSDGVIRIRPSTDFDGDIDLISVKVVL